ncbi:MAG TPA: hypothetical protein VGT02_07400 [Methylomirabilota bacterium]|nr:hypothetical protein [Methylomirabilota bacterium]
MDSLLILGPYAVWCLVAAIVWRWLVAGRRMAPARRALLVAVLFAPTLHPIVREAAILAPASLSLIAMLVIGLAPVNRGAVSSDLLRYVLVYTLVPLLAVWGLAWAGMRVAVALTHRSRIS